MPVDRPTLHLWLHHWQDEGDAAFLYTVLSAQEPDPRKRQIYDKLADVERRHTELWAKLLGDNGHAVPAAGPRPPPTTPLIAGRDRRGGGAPHDPDLRGRGDDRRRPVDGVLRVPRCQERAGGVRARDRDGEGRDPTDARRGGGGDRPGLRGQGDRVGAGAADGGGADA